jgi:hypothetical protein
LISQIKTYDADKLGESESKFDFYFHAHVLHGSNEFVVTAKEIAHEPFFILRARSYHKLSKLNKITLNVLVIMKTNSRLEMAAAEAATLWPLKKKCIHF